MTTKTKETLQKKLTLTLPKAIVEDLGNIASYNDTNLEKLVYSYIIDGIAGDSRAARRKEFTDKANEVLGKNNIPPKSVEDIFSGLVY